MRGGQEKLPTIRRQFVDNHRLEPLTISQARGSSPQTIKEAPLNLPIGSLYNGDEPFRILCPSDMLKVAQDQHSDNQDARIVRHRELLCPVLSNLNSRNDLIALSVENPLIADDDLADLLCLDGTELMRVWEARPVSIFGCLVSSCRAPIPVRNRTHLLRLLRLDRYFGLKVGAGDPVEFKALCEMLCESCAQEQRRCLDEHHRTQQLAVKARHSELRTMARVNYGEYLKTPELRAMKNRARIRAGNRCQLCGTSDKPLDCHHNSYRRLGGNELLEDFVVLCRSCHQRYHGIEPKAA